MKKRKKILFNTLGMMIVLSPTLAIISCGPSKRTIKNGKEGIFFITSGGDINDHSFNQSVYEGYKEALGYDKLAEDKVPNVYKPVDPKAIKNSYSAAKDDGAWLIVAPGYLHQSIIEEYAQHSDDLYFLYIDGAVSMDKGGKQVRSILYNMRQPSFIMGVLAAKKAIDMANADNGDKTPNIGVYGGVDMPPVVDYIVGFKKGVEWYNNYNKDGLKVDVVDGGFAENFETGGKSASISNNLISKGVELAMAVGALQYKDLLTAIKQTNGNSGNKNRTNGKTLVIGVDTDLREQSGSELIWASILKGLKDATRNAIQDVMENYVKKNKDKKDFFGVVHKGNLETNEVGIVVYNEQNQPVHGTTTNKYTIGKDLLDTLKGNIKAEQIIEEAKKL